MYKIIYIGALRAMEEVPYFYLSLFSTKLFFITTEEIPNKGKKRNFVIFN